MSNENNTDRRALRSPLGSERGQSTAEYALILVAIAAMVGLVISFLGGEGGGLITGLFGSVFDNLSSFIPGIG